MISTPPKNRSKTSRLVRSVMVLALCASLPLAQAQSSNQWVQDCYTNQTAVQQSNAATLPARMADDPYFQYVANNPVSTGSNFSCYDATRSGINSMLSQASGIFGVNLSSIFGSSLNSASGSACGAAQQAVRGTFGNFNIPCPSGVACKVVRKATSYATGAVTNAANSTYSNGSYATGSSSYYTAPTASSTNSGGVVSNVTNTVSCFISGGCNGSSAVNDGRMY